MENSTVIPQAEAAIQPQAEAAPKKRGPLTAVLAALFTLIAWLLLPVDGVASAIASLVALVMCIVALRRPRGAWRNLVLASTVASAVLLLVLVVFWTALIYFLS